MLGLFAKSVCQTFSKPSQDMCRHLDQIFFEHFQFRSLIFRNQICKTSRMNSFSNLSLTKSFILSQSLSNLSNLFHSFSIFVKSFTIFFNLSQSYSIFVKSFTIFFKSESFSKLSESEKRFRRRQEVRFCG